MRSDMNSPDTDTATKTLTVVNPYDLSPVDTVTENTPADIENALAGAFALFRGLPGCPVMNGSRYWKKPFH